MAMNKRLIWPSKEEMRLRIDEVPIPEPPPEGAIIKVRYAGICRSDVSVWKDDWCPNLAFPRVMGHEIAGHIHSLGANAKKDLAVGDTVMVYGPDGCGNCDFCKGDGSHFCLDDKAGLSPFYGLTKDGGFQHYVVIEHVRALLKVPSTLPLDVACLLPCGGLTAYNAVATAKGSIDFSINHGGKATFLVIGAGGLGLWAVHQARALWPKGLKVAVADVTEEKLAQAKEEGADVTILWDRTASAEDMAKKTRELCGGGIDGSVDFVNTPQSVAIVFHAANKNCTLALIGIHKEATMQALPLRLFPIRTIHIRGVFMGSRKQLADLLDLVVNKGVKPPPIQHVTLGDVNDVFERLLAGKQPGRAVIDMEK